MRTYLRPLGDVCTAKPAANFLIGLCVLWAILSAGPAGAQANSTAEGEPAGSIPARVSERIVLPLALDAQNELEAADRLIEKRQWELALPMLQELLSRDAERVLWDGQAYASVGRVVNARIAALPQEARRIYRLLYDPSAGKLCVDGTAMRSEPMLRKAASVYLNTTHGPKAASTLASLLMDEGEFGAALLALQETDVLPVEPGLAGRIAAKKLICLARLGLRADADRLLGELRKAGVTHFEAAGRQWEPEAFVEEAFSQLGPPATTGRLNTWVTTGGSAAGTRVPPAFEPDALSPVTVHLPWMGEVSPRLPSVASLRPVANERTMFVNRDGTVFAVDRKSGRIRWVAGPSGGWLELGLGVAGADPTDEWLLPIFLPVTNLHQWRTFDNHGLASLSLAGNRLFAVQMNPQDLQFPDPLWEATPENLLLTNELRCYDTETGTLMWRAGGGARSSVPSLGDCWFFTAPTVQRGRAYVLAVRHGTLHAVCLDAGSGKPLWDSVIGAFESRQEALRFGMELFLADTAPPSLSHGIVVFPTGQGIVCAYDAYGGQLRWIATYERSAVGISRLSERLNVPTGPWSPRQPPISSGLCLLTPTDSRHLIALSLRTGQLVWQVAFPRGTALLGEMNGRAYVQHDGITCLEVPTGRVLMEKPSTVPSTGIGALGRRCVYIPEQGGVRRINAESGHTEDILPWPAESPQAGWCGNLLLLDDALVASAPDRLILWLTADLRRDALAAAEARVAARPDAYEPLLLRAQVLASAGETAKAVKDLERALELAEFSEQPAALAEVAIAQLRVALQQLQESRAEGRQPDPGGCAALYFDLCRRWGKLDRPGSFASASLWTQLAGIVRQHCTERPELARAWSEQVNALISDALTAGDETALLGIVRWGPFSDARIAALLKLGHVWRQAGELHKARRAFAEALLEGEGAAAKEAAEGVRQVMAAAGLRESAAGYIAALKASAAWTEPAGDAEGPQLSRVPTDRTAWSEVGLMVLPTGPVAPALREKVLVLERTRLKCLNAQDGSSLWTVGLPAPPQPSGPPRGARSAMANYIGPGYPAYWTATPRTLLTLPGALIGIDTRNEELLWQHRFSTWGAQMAAHRPISHMELIQRAVRGLPVQSERMPMREVPMDGFTAGPLAACRVAADRDVTVVDPLTGQKLLDLAQRRRGELRGALAAVAGAKVCLLLPDADGPRLLIFDAKDGDILARWRFPPGIVVKRMIVTSASRLLLAHDDGIFTMDLRLMRVSGKWPVQRGVGLLVYADEEVVLVRTMDGTAVGLDGRSGARLFSLDGPEDRSVVWASRRDDTLYMLEAAELHRIIPYGPERHFLGSGFCLRAVRLPEATPLWRYTLHTAGPEVVGPPVSSGEVWLLRASEAGRVRIVAVDSRTGRAAFDVELAGGRRPEPVPLLVSGDRIVVGTGGQVIGLQAGTRTVQEAVAQARAPAP